MGRLITSLTPAQRARLRESLNKWWSIRRSTQPADRSRAEGAIAALYRLAKLRPPPVVWAPCPLSAALSATVHAGLIDERVGINCAVDAAVYIGVDPDLRHAVGSAVHSAVRPLARHGSNSRVDLAVRDAVDSAEDIVVQSGASYDVISAVREGMCPWMRDPADVEMQRAVLFAVERAADGVRRSVCNDKDIDTLRYSIDLPLGHRRAAWTMDPATKAGLACAASVRAPGGCASTDYFNQVLGMPIDRRQLDLVQSCAHVWMLSDVCFAAERCRSIERDDRGRFHCASGPAIRYASGWGLWFWHGVGVPRVAIELPQTLSVSHIEREANVEVRRVMIERYGQARFLMDAGATLVHEDARGKLWRKEVMGDEPIVMVQVRNATPEADGSCKEYFLRVPSYMSKASEAVAWTFGLDARTYRPYAES